MQTPEQQTEFKNFKNKVFNDILTQLFPIIKNSNVILNFPKCEKKGFKLKSSKGKLLKASTIGQVKAYGVLAKFFPNNVFKIKTSKDKDNLKESNWLMINGQID